MRTFQTKNYLQNCSKPLLENLRKEKCYRNIFKHNKGKSNGAEDEEMLERFTRKNCSFTKVIKRKRDKLYVKWKDYKTSSNSWIDKKT